MSPRTRPSVRAALAALACAAFAGSAPADDGQAPPAPAAGAPAAPAPAAPAAAEATWFADFDRAAAAAKEQKKDLLVDFTGSDWCGWCKKLHAEVFAQPEFVAEAPKDFVLVALDFPHAPEVKAQVPNPARNAELAKKYAIGGYPTVLVLTPEGRVVAQTGYRPGGAAQYVAHLAEIRKEGAAVNRSIDALRAEFDGAAGDAKLVAAAKAMDLLEKAEGRGAAVNALPIVRDALPLDPTGEKGVKERALRKLLGAGDDSAAADAAAWDPKNERGLLELAILSKMSRLVDDAGLAAFVKEAKALADTGNLRDGQVCVRVLATAVNICVRKTNDMETARAIAKVLREKGPQDDARLTKFLDGVLGAEAAPPK